MKERAGAETTLHVVADEDELGDPPLLEAGEDVAADPHGLPLEGIDGRREDGRGVRLPLRQRQREIVKRDLPHLPIPDGRGLRGNDRRLGRGWRAAATPGGGLPGGLLRHRCRSPGTDRRNARFRRTAGDREAEHRQHDGPRATGGSVSAHGHPPGGRRRPRRHRRPLLAGSRTGRRSSAGAGCTRSSVCQPSGRGPGR